MSVIYGNRILINDPGLEIGRWILPKHKTEVLRWIDYVPQETMFWRRSIWEAVGGKLDESLHFAIDWDLLPAISKSRSSLRSRSSIPGSVSRSHPQQKTSAQMTSLGAREIAGLRNQHLGYVPSEEEVSDRVKWYLYRHLLEHARIRLKDRFRA